MPTSLYQIAVDFHIFDRSLSNFMYLYRGHSASTSLGRREGVDEESNKKEGVQSKK